MEPFKKHAGIGVPIRISNIDTDQLLPARFMKQLTKTGYAEGLLDDWRTENPDFILNVAPYSRGTVLVAGPNFGVGSSREHAVWALMDYGFRVVISSKFGDIFRDNCGKQGLIAARCRQEDIEEIWGALEATPGCEVAVDLLDQKIELEGSSYSFQIDPYTRWRLVEGLDDIGLTLRHEPAIAAYEARRPSWSVTTVGRYL